MHQNFVFYKTALFITTGKEFIVLAFCILITSVDFNWFANLGSQCYCKFVNKKFKSTINDKQKKKNWNTLSSKPAICQPKTLTSVRFWFSSS